MVLIVARAAAAVRIKAAQIHPRDLLVTRLVCNAVSGNKQASKQPPNKQYLSQVDDDSVPLPAW
jgi:hypothetical protein